ncbi:MAG: ParB/RepB/Spo0J family partition protein [Bacteriovoracales bacterium]
MNKKPGMALGRGAAALFGKAPTIPTPPSPPVMEELETVEVTPMPKELPSGPLMVAISQITPNPNQPRKIFKQDELIELSNSIKENGIISPILVCENDNGFELIAGERRLRAATMAGLDKVPVIVKRATDKEKKIMAIIENVQREDLNCVEEGLAYYNLIEEFKLTQEEVAKKLGKERSTIANFLRILRLPREVLDLLQKDVLTFGHAKVLAAEDDRDIILRLTNKAVSEQMSVRELERQLKKEKRAKKPEHKEETIDDRLDSLRQKLEQRTGFHFLLSSNKSGAGQVTIKFNNESELNNIYDYLVR